MKSIIKKIGQGLMLVPAFALVLSFASVPAHAVVDGTCDEGSITLSEGADCAKGDEQATTLFGEGGIFAAITNVLLFLIGAIAVIMLIIGGIRYVISGGDQAQVTSAKNTILYAIVGIVVAFLAYAAVNFVTQALVGANAT
jgi:hypothetical protein